MGDFEPSVHQASEEGDPSAPLGSFSAGESSGSAFHSQLEYVAQQQHFYPMQQATASHGQQAFDMSTLAAGLPQLGLPHMATRPHHGAHEPPGVLSPASVYQMQQASQYAAGRNSQYDSLDASRAQPQYLGSSYVPFPQHSNLPPRAPMSYPNQGQYPQMDPYGYNYNPAVSPIDPRFPAHGPYGMMPSFHTDPSNFARRPSEPAPVPSFPRGPPRKPKQSGHALWVGNLPPAATVMDLKDHFSRDATGDIESLFLISKSNCAFVNYKSEAACIAAMNRFHDSRFHGVRLVCRLRRGSTIGSSSLAPPVPDAPDTPSSGESIREPPSPSPAKEPSSPTIVASGPLTTSGPRDATAGTSGEDAPTVPEKYFIVKSLTVQDLEASVRNGIWATQSHNEVVLNRAYDEAENVYLIFSANKSGEYFGYARMASPISGNPVNLSQTTSQEEVHSSGAPQSIPTPATATAPKGRIIDDSARGTIFWEAEHSDNEDGESPAKHSTDGETGQTWGRQFEIKWLSTSRLPFYRTRGLRNPWNANREVKIARDGTELEPSVGRRLVQMFHRSSPSPAISAPSGMPLR